MTIFRRSLPVASRNPTIEGFIIDLRTARVSSLRPRSSIIGATCAIPSRVSTPRMVRTGANRPGISSPNDRTSRRRTRRLASEVMNSGGYDAADGVLRSTRYNSSYMGVSPQALGRGLVTAVVLCAGSACHSTQMKTAPPIVQPGAPGEPSRVIGKEQAVDLSQVQHTQADVRFIQGMIGHRAGAGDDGPAAVAYRQRRHAKARPAHRGVAVGRDQDDAALAGGSRPAGPGSACAPCPRRHTDARDADARREHARRTRRATPSIACSSSS